MDEPRESRTRARRLALLALVLAGIQGTLLASTAWDKADTSDEGAYIGSAALLWAHHDFSTLRAPVPKWGFALGMWVADPSLDQAPIDRRLTGERAAFGWRNAAFFMLWHRPQGEMRRNLFAARMATVTLTVVAGLFLWSAARRFGGGAAFVTHALWCFSPTVLANGSLATLDAWVAGLLTIALWCTARFVEEPLPRRAALAGAAVGLAMGSKIFGLGVLPVMAIVGGVVLARRRGAERRSWRKDAAVCLLALVAGIFTTLWAAHLFAVGTVSTFDLTAHFGWPERRFGPLPFPTWIEGLISQTVLGPVGRRNYLFGETSKTGWWWFYLACLAFKTTIGAQVLAVLRTAAMLRLRPGRRELEIDAAILAYPLLLLVLMSLGNTQAGIRYLLPGFPFAFLWLGRAIADAGRAFGRVGTILGSVALLAAATESVAVHPDHLMFFNPWAGGPTGGPRYLIQCDDWGQDQRRLAEWQQKRGIDAIFYTPYPPEPRSWGIQFKRPPCSPRRGVYALHAVEVHRPKLTDPGCLDWLTVEPPDERIGHSIYIYYVDRERLERLKAERWTDRPFFRSGPPPNPRPGPSPEGLEPPENAPPDDPAELPR